MDSVPEQPGGMGERSWSRRFSPGRGDYLKMDDEVATAFRLNHSNMTAIVWFQCVKVRLV